MREIDADAYAVLLDGDGEECGARMPGHASIDIGPVHTTTRFQPQRGSGHWLRADRDADNVTAVVFVDDQRFMSIPVGAMKALEGASVKWETRVLSSSR